MQPVDGAKGSFGEVWSAVFQTARVAVKKPRERDPESNQLIVYTEDDFKTQNDEFLRWSRLPRHPNVLPLYGACVNKEQHTVWLVSPFIPNGSLVQVMTNTRPPPWLKDEWVHLVLTHVAGGLKHLHAHHLLHLDCTRCR
jgi:serine/threonine protein kinase